MASQKSVIYFYSPEIEKVPKDSVQAVDPKFYSTGLHHWVHFTYCYFKYIDHSHAFDVIMTSSIPEQGIIVFHRGWFPSDLKPNSKQLFVCLLVDCGRHRYAQIQVVHNPKSVDNFRRSIKSLLDKCFRFTKEVFIASWPQPGLIARSEDRGYKVENICFMGHPKNLPKELKTKEWLKKCHEMKVNFQVIDEASKWSDFSQIDLILAMRSFDNRPYYHKPFLKITNAMLAGVPVIATRESSHLYLKYEKKVDFQIVDSIIELASIVKLMKDNPTLEFQKVEINQKLIKDYTSEAVFKAYNQLFKECAVKLQRWSAAGKVQRFFYLKFRGFRFTGK